MSRQRQRAEPATGPVLTAVAVTKRYAGHDGEPVTALRDVSFELQPGTVTGLVGALNAGRTTLLRIAAGLSRPTGGEMHGVGSRAFLHRLIKRLDPDLSLRENLVGTPVWKGGVVGAPAVLSSAALTDLARRCESDDLLKGRVGELPRARIVALLEAAALATGPRLVLNDGSLLVGEGPARAVAFSKLNELVAEGSSVLFAPRQLTDVTRLCDRALWLDGGELRADGDPEAVVAEFRRASGPSSLVVPAPATAPERRAVRLPQMRLVAGDGDKPRRVFEEGTPVRLEISVTELPPELRPHVSLDIAWERNLVARSFVPVGGEASASLSAVAEFSTQQMPTGLYRAIARLVLRDPSDRLVDTVETQAKFFLGDEINRVGEEVVPAAEIPTVLLRWRSQDSRHG